ncbi:condensation domain-containing protein [Streptomyces europaeiscabiei]|uniref:condensation domain-containing protein n=1 Tax=Streptomyces europaeiscabiei TaxID=146819 RepID=UPI0029ABF061|nr:condensation domain-containing protein [Streptomyces europaeiscabiei]MDX2525273.1 condensation domain-containing protein [Streptomyces europaeiscabiei]
MEKGNRKRRFIDFHGKGSGTYDLTWSQKQVCLWMEQAAPHFANMNIGRLVQFEEGTTVAEVEAALKVLMERHEALRTRIHLDSFGAYRQVVHHGGRLPVDILECATEEEAASILADMNEIPFTAVEWPLRVAVLVSAEKVERVALCVSHVASDGWGMEVLCREMDDLVSSNPGRNETVSCRPVIQPREQADWEKEKGDSASRRVEKFWTKHLKCFPNDRFPVPRGSAESPRFPEIVMKSRAAASAIERIAERDQVTSHTVVLGALSVLLGAISRTRRATFRLFCANRPSDASQSSLGNFYQVVPISVEVGDLPFSEVVRKTWQASMRAYLLGPGDPDRLSALEKSLSHDLGVDPDLECFINLHESRRDSSSAARGASPEVPGSTRVWKEGGIEVWESGKFYVDVWTVSDHFMLSLWGDTTLFSSDVLSGFLSCLEHILLRAAADGELSADETLQEVEHLIDVPMQDGLEYVDGCWVNLSEVRHTLVDCLSPRGVEVVLDREAGAAERRITAYLELGGRSLTVRGVHQLVLDGIRGRRFVMAPHQYVICDGVPDPSKSAEAWTRQPVLSEGSGRL